MAACCALAAYLIYSLVGIQNRLRNEIGAWSPSIDRSHAKSPLAPGNIVTPSEEQDDGRHTTCRFALNGLTCSTCVNAVLGACENLPGVREVTVSLASSSAIITFESAKVNPAQLAAAIADAGYGATLLQLDEPWRNQWIRIDDARETEVTTLKRAFFASVVCTGILAATDLIRTLPLQQDAPRRFAALRSAIGSLPVLLFAFPIHREAASALKRRHPNSALLSSCSVLFGLFATAHQTFKQQPIDSSPERFLANVSNLTSICLLTTVIIGGRLIKMMSSKQSIAFPTRLAFCVPQTARLISETGLMDDAASVPTDLLRPGDKLLVPPSAAFPADGRILQNSTAVLETFVTGEMVPKVKNPGDLVYCGCVNTSAETIIQVLRTGNDTWLGQTLKTCTDLNRTKGKLESRADALLTHFSMGVLAFAASCGLYYGCCSDKSTAWILQTISAVLCSACPCSLGLSIPNCVSMAIANASKAGIMINAGTAQFESLLQARTIIFDKTGTLTLGRPEIRAAYIDPSWYTDLASLQLFWGLVSCLEQNSDHPVALALCNYSKQYSSSFSKRLLLESAEEFAGLGIRGIVIESGTPYAVAVGNRRFMNKLGFDDSFNQGSISPDCIRAGHGETFVSIGSAVCGRLWYSEKPHPYAKTLIQDLKKRSLAVHICTGDASAPAFAIADELGIPRDTVSYGLLPAEKAELIQKLERRNGPCIMVGDSLNDASAIASASFGISICVDSSKSTSLVEGDALLLPMATHNQSSKCNGLNGLSRILCILDLIQETLITMQRILKWSIIYNIIILALASGLLSAYLPTQLQLTSSSAGVAMASNSIMTLSYSLRLSNWKPPHSC